MARTKLTAGRIRDFACPPDACQAFLWDSEVPGLAVRATPAGSKAFVFQAKLNGKAIRITIGDVRAWSIESSAPTGLGARQEARRLQGLIDQGIDPRHDKQDRIAEAEARRAETRRQDVTVADAWESYIEARRPHWSERHLVDHCRLAHAGGDTKKRGKGLTQPGVLATLMPLKLAEVTPEHVKAWLRDETAKRPTQARLAFGALRAFLNWCSDTPKYTGLTHPDACTNRIARQSLPKKKAKSDCLQREQLKAWFEAVRRIENPVMSAYLQALLLTGARREELASLPWSNVDLRWKALTIKDKVDGERTIPLTPYVHSLLLDLKRLNETPPNIQRLRDADAPQWKPSPWVFSSPASASGRLQEPRIPHKKALRLAGIDDLTLHGLRRSFGTLAEWVECPAGVVAQIMGHKPSATAEKHYRQRPLDLLRMWHTRIETWILEQAGIEVPEADEQLHAVK